MDDKDDDKVGFEKMEKATDEFGERMAEVLKDHPYKIVLVSMLREAFSTGFCDGRHSHTTEETCSLLSLP